MPMMNIGAARACTLDATMQPRRNETPADKMHLVALGGRPAEGR
jgi:hypothetical protein